eukprot:11508846-Alexandrium_andersonii.AAC.4
MGWQMRDFGGDGMLRLSPRPDPCRPAPSARSPARFVIAIGLGARDLAACSTRALLGRKAGLRRTDSAWLGVCVCVCARPAALTTTLLRLSAAWRSVLSSGWGMGVFRTCAVSCLVGLHAS